MSSFHGQTRPDVPRIPQDLATKAYVDDTTGDTMLVGQVSDTTLNNGSIQFNGYFSRGALSSNEFQREWIIPITATLSDLFISLRSNTMNDVTEHEVRIDGSTTALAITIPASSSGVFSNTSDNVSIIAGQLMAFRLDGTASSSGGEITTAWALVVNT